MALDGPPVDSLATVACFSSTRAAYALHCLEAAERPPIRTVGDRIKIKNLNSPAMIWARDVSGEAVAEWFKYETEPMDLANMRQNGVRSLAVTCHGCRHEVILNADKHPMIC